MTHFNIDYTTDRPDHIAVELDRRFDVMLIRTDAGLEIRVYPRTKGELWDEPFTVFTVDEREIIAFETAMND